MFHSGNNWSQSHGKEQKIKHFPATLSSIIISTRSLNQVVLDDSDETNRIVQINVLNAIYSVFIVIYKYMMLKSCMRFTVGYIHQGITVLIFYLNINTVILIQKCFRFFK